MALSSDCIYKSFLYKQDAIDWAEAFNNSNSEIVIFEESKEHPFTQALDAFRRKGYSGVRVSTASHSGPTHIEFWLDNFWYYNSNYFLEWICKGWERDLSICIGEDYDQPYIPFSKLKNSFDTNYEKLRGSCEEVFSWEEVLDRSMSNIYRRDYPHMYRKSPFERIEEGGIEMYGDFILIHRGYRSISFSDKKRKPLILESGRIEDVLINTAQIIAVEPILCEYRVTDPGFIETIERIIQF